MFSGKKNETCRHVSVQSSKLAQSRMQMFSLTIIIIYEKGYETETIITYAQYV
jgi:hypothetical protein